MGQTLTHGIYLPDEGERNCYNGLAANWSILDNAVGTVAEHTSALSGKAPLVHTHTKADITDFPAYGNAAGTICEGNDSRLSDARTPVAHTHTKSDVTDLLNSNFIPSANNSYDLGSSSYQWNNLYAKNYYYNGIEFQNKFVTLDTEQLITGLKRLKSGWWRLQAANLKAGAGESYGRNGYTLVWTDKDDITICDIASYKQSQAAKTYLRLRGGDYYTDGVPDASGTLVQSDLRIGTLANGTRMIECYTDAMYPGNDNTADLGTSTNKWKTLNGINPGALSLPNLTMKTYDPNNGWYNLDTTDWDLTGSPTDISSDVLKDGYLYICLACDSTGYVIICEGAFGYPNCFYSASGLPVSGYARALLPVRRDTNVRIYLKGTSVYTARLFPALGNV